MRSHYCTLLVLITLQSICSASETAKEPFRLGAILSEESGTVYQPMDCESLERKVQRALRKYYEGSLGGAENWDQLSSLTVKGNISLVLDGQVVEFSSNRKKPDLNKTVLKPSGEGEIILSFDGDDAWQQIVGKTDPVDMPAAIALEFSRDSVFGTHLLYPQLPGKQVTYLGETRIDGTFCYRVEVALPNGQSLVHAIDIETGVPLALEYISGLDSKKYLLHFSDFREVSGVLIPYKTETYLGDELQKITTLTSVEANRGLGNWIFQRR
ncbi:MAG: hypothetical protein ACON4O_02310 [Lentimonas sp.]